MAQTILIIYMSRATCEMDTPALEMLAAKAAAKNSRQNITGLLIKAGNYFMQVLEGPPNRVKELLDKIAVDPRHRQVRILFREPSEVRIFGQWSMGSLNLDEKYAVELGQFRQIREEVEAIMASETASKDAMLRLIQAFPAILRKNKAAA